MFLHEILNEDTRRDVLRKFGAGAAAAAGVTGAKADELDDFVAHYSKQNNMPLAPVDDDKLGIIIQFLNDAKEKLATQPLLQFNLLIQRHQHILHHNKQKALHRSSMNMFL